MSKHRALLVVAALAGAAGLFVGRFGGADAAAAKPSLVATFGPIQVEGNAKATFFLALNNTGAADATLALGDRIEIRYGTRGGAGDLLAAGQTMTFDPLPVGIVEQPILDGPGAEIGARLAVTGPVTIGAGSSLLLTFAGATAPAGGAPVAVSMKFGKTAGRSPKAISVSVVKTTSVAQSDFYGDGTDGSPPIADGAALQPLRNYDDVIIPAGATVTAASGTTIRCRGRFENDGRIIVTQGSPGGGVLIETSSFSTQVYPPTFQAERGDALSCPSTPAATNSQPVKGAQGGLGLGAAVQSLPLSHYRLGGGGGTGTLGVLGGAGGGVLRVLARGPIVNKGRIEARGLPSTANRTGFPGADGAGGGGGGGGVVILASGTSVENATPTDGNNPYTGGVVDVTGGDGGTADLVGGAGGGGGGGLVVFCAPSVVANGTTYLQAGLSGFPKLNPDIPTSYVYWCGGGGGGACAGDGGGGGPVRAGGLVGPADGDAPPFGTPGQLVVRTSDPMTLWR
jgi:hypothetical protein